VAEALHRFSNHWVSWRHWEAVFTLSVAAARDLGDLALQAAQLNHLAWSQAACYRRYQRCVEHALTAHRIAAEAGDVRQQAWALAYAAYGYRELGEAGRCADLARRAAALALEAGDQEAYSQALARLGDGLHGLGRPGEAMDVRVRLAAVLTTPGIGIHPELAAVTLAGVYVQLGAHHADAHVQHQAVQAAQRRRRIRHHRRARVRCRHVGQHDRGGLSSVPGAFGMFGTDQGRGRFRGGRVTVGTGYRRALPGCEHGNGPAVAGRRIRFRRWPRPAPTTSAVAD